ncbi:hypothetical protein ALC56_01631 [Trachymyrmex septentrionalis]|uniref:C2H2-type domain-containing protein n=1 Tax=Trachymyrmex septentrionalis TaxID=34720 RepID=A0A195FTZ1_9HYME|nr:hypothetical protein ALC56_01631 [Trachymyrmex septentrionalis]
MVNHRANVEDITNVVEHIRNMDPEQFANIRNELFEVLEEINVDFEEIMDQDSDEEVLSDDTGYVSDLSEHDTNHAEKFVPSPEIRALNGRIKHYIVQCYYTMGGGEKCVKVMITDKLVMPYYDCEENPAKKVFRDLYDKYMHDQLCYLCKECTSVDEHNKKQHIIEPTLTSLKEFQERNSRWALSRILNLVVNVKKLNPMRAECYFEVPREIATKRAVINVRTTDNACFAWSVVAGLYSAEKYAERESSYPHYMTVLNLAGIEFPMTLKNIHKFERLNAVSINVYGIENKQVLPLRLISDKKEKHVNVLYIQDPRDDGIGHFAWTKNLSRLVSWQLSKKEHKKYFCDRCLHYFNTNEKLQLHTMDCQKINDCAIRLPSADEKWLEFGNHCNKERVPFVIYTDLEFYISFTKHVYSTKDKTENNSQNNCVKLRFIDSFKFLSTSLDKLASYLDKDKLKIIRSKFSTLSDNEFELLTRKVEKLQDTRSSPYESFYRLLRGDTVSQSDYTYAANVWQRFSIRTLSEYSDFRTRAKNNFEKNLYKLMNNAVFSYMRYLNEKIEMTHRQSCIRSKLMLLSCRDVKGCEKRTWLWNLLLDDERERIETLDAVYEDIESLTNLDVTNTMRCGQHVKNCAL